MKKETLCIQGGYNPGESEPRIVPIVQSTTYSYEHPDTLADLFDLKAQGHMYSRISNPTVAVLEEKIALLEKGVGALAVSSGQSATLLAILNICKSGDHILASQTLYGGTITLLTVTLKKLGIETTLVNQDESLETLLSYGKENTKLVFAESISNPNPNVLDFDKFSNLSKTLGVPLVIDNTLATPYLCNPFDHGADIIVHSATKYLDGHATSLGGIIVDKGTFNWNNGKYPEFVEPDPSYHGLKYVETFGELAYITKARVQLLRDFGTTLSPMNSFLINLGTETLGLRMDRHSKNAHELATYLEKNDKVKWVQYSNLESSANYQLSKKYLPLGASGILTFGYNGSFEETKEFIERLKLVRLVVHLGDVRSSVAHPASTTHRQLKEEELLKAGVDTTLIRVSVGIEAIEDIIADFEQAFDQ